MALTAIGILYGALMALMQGSAAKAGLMRPLSMAALAAASGGICAVAAPVIGKSAQGAVLANMALSAAIPAAVYSLIYCLRRRKRK